MLGCGSTDPTPTRWWRRRAVWRQALRLALLGALATSLIVMGSVARVRLAARGHILGEQETGVEDALRGG